MRFASVLCTAEDSVEAIEDAVEQLSTSLTEVDLIVVFATPHHSAAQTHIIERLTAAFPGALLVGSQAAGVLASGLEVEESPGLAILGAHLPGVGLHAFHLDRALVPTAEEAALAVAEALGDTPIEGLMVLSDPFTFDLAQLLPALTAALPGVPVFGGQASGAQAPGPHAMLLRERPLRGGVICVAMSGAVRIETLVAQGCRPVGPPMFVTRCKGNLLLELDGQSPVAVLKDIYEGLPVDDQERFRQGQYLGLQMQEQTEYHRGDFLIRHVLGVPEDGNGLAVAAPLHLYDVVQLHVRDGATSHQDLVSQLSARVERKPAGALLFTCLGRGRGLYGEPHHDSRCFQEEVGEVAVAGFFANGELGPVHGVPYVHGYTSVFALFHPV